MSSSRMRYQNDWDSNKYKSLHHHLRVLLWCLRGECTSIYSCPYLSSPRIFEEKKKSKIIQFSKAIQQNSSFPTSLADMKMLYHGHTHILLSWCLLQKSYCERQETTNFYSKYTKRFWATCRIPKKLETQLKLNLVLKFSCFHFFSWVLREALSWKYLQCQSLEFSSIKALLSTAKQGYIKK